MANVPEEEYLPRVRVSVKQTMNLLKFSMNLVVKQIPILTRQTTEEPNPVTHKGTTHKVTNNTTPPISQTTRKAGPIDCSVADKHYPHETNCHQYYWCYGGTAHLETCATGTVWDTNLNLCNYPNVANRPGCES